jgi:DNA-binding transcriptional LysR family regulator
MHVGFSLRQIETFYWIARFGSFSEAAAHLNATQPAVSNRISELESYLRVQLFVRGGRSVSLTPAGRELLEVAEKFVQLSDEFLSRAEARSEIAGLLRLGAADTIALTWLPRLVAELSRRFPRVYVELFVDLSIHIQAKLMSGDLDVGFLVGTAPTPEFLAVPLGSVENAWMCAPGLGLTGRPVEPEELASVAVLTHTRGSHLHQGVKDWFKATGVRRLRFHGCSSLASMIELTAAGLGISVLPIKMVTDRFGPDRLAPVDVRPTFPSTPFSCIYARRNDSAILEEAIAIARREIAADPRFEVDAIKALEFRSSSGLVAIS